MIQQVLVRGVLYSGSDKARRLIFITVFNIKVVIAYLPTPPPINVVDEF